VTATVPPRTTGPAGLPALRKAPTGIAGLDEITGGGLPQGRATLVCGPAGSGKTLLGLEFLVRGIITYGDPGVFVAFEETAADLAENVASLGFDLAGLQADGLLVVDHVDTTAASVEEAGEWDLEALFLRLGSALDQVGAKRVVLDTLENLFGAFSDSATVRAELRRLFGWLKARGVTAVVTGERGDGMLTRHGIEEYVSDCVIVLDHRVVDQTSTRRLRVLKYRGSLHGTNEYPFSIGQRGLSVLPITSLGLRHEVSSERLSTGNARLDGMLGGAGVFRGSSVLISGTAGTAKSTFAAQLCDAACRRGDRALYVSFEESQSQILRNMASVGMDLDRWVRAGLLHFHCVRPSVLGLEEHLGRLQELVTEVEPDVVVLDPISDLMSVGRGDGAWAMLTRELDHLKSEGITAVLTALVGPQLDSHDEQVASLIDTWLLLTSVEGNGERNRALYVLKSRGMAHSNQIREFLLTDAGIELADVYVGSERVLMGSARSAQEAEDRLRATVLRQDREQRRIDLERRRASVEAQAAILWREFEAERDAVERLLRQGSSVGDDVAEQRVEQGRLRSADSPADTLLPGEPEGPA
jgi:circadian clock protein KaiC